MLQSWSQLGYRRVKLALASFSAEKHRETEIKMRWNAHPRLSGVSVVLCVLAVLLTPTLSADIVRRSDDSNPLEAVVAQQAQTMGQIQADLLAVKTDLANMKRRGKLHACFRQGNIKFQTLGWWMRTLKGKDLTFSVCVCLFEDVFFSNRIYIQHRQPFFHVVIFDFFEIFVNELGLQLLIAGLLLVWLLVCLIFIFSASECSIMHTSKG